MKIAWYNMNSTDFHLIYYATITIQFLLKPNKDQIRDVLDNVLFRKSYGFFFSSQRISQNTSQFPTNSMMFREDTFCVIL